MEFILQCMDSSQPHSVRTEGFKLAQCLTVMEEIVFHIIS